MECLVGYACKCVPSCRLRDTCEEYAKWRKQQERRRNGENNGRHGNSPRRNNRETNNQTPRRKDEDNYIPMPCQQTGLCMGARCSMFQDGQGCRRPDLRGLRTPKPAQATNRLANEPSWTAIAKALIVKVLGLG